MSVDFGVSLEVIGERMAYDVTLREDSDRIRDILTNLGEEEGIVSASEEERIDLGVGRKGFVDILFDEEIGTGAGRFTGFDQGDPHGASGLGDIHIGVKFGDLELIRVATDRAGSSEQADMTRTGKVAYGFDSRADDAEDSMVGIRDREDMLLDRAEGLGAGSVASQDYQVATTAEEFLDRLAGEIEDDVETSRSVRGSGVIAEI